MKPSILSKLDIEEKILNVLKEFDPQQLLTDEQILNEDYRSINFFDSIGYISLIVRLEEVFEIEISDEYLIMENLSNFTVLVNLVQEILEKNES